MNESRNKSLKLLIYICIIFVSLMIFSSASFASTSPTANGKVTEAEGVNIRSSYDTSSSKVGAIPQYGIVTVTKEKYTDSASYAADTRWYYVESSYGDGWVRADLLTITYTNCEAVANSSANVRKGAGTGFETVGSVKDGDAVTVRLITYPASSDLEEKAWYKVLYGGYNRYIFAKYVDLEENSNEDENAESVINTNFENELVKFPSSYHSALKASHEEYPTWHFKAKVLSYTWSDALDEQMYSYAINTIPSSKPDSYKAVAADTYNFNEHYYYSMDGSGWVAASEKAVAYYMDPRNWLDEINVFMFESLTYDSATQKESMVKQLLSETAIATKYSTSYMTAGSTYGISPVYLAAKSRLELGTSSFMVDGHEFTYNGKTYKGYYNAYNIGASDSAEIGRAHV